MTDTENLKATKTPNQFKISRLQYLSWKQFNGKLSIESGSGLKWSLDFSQGKALWATGGVHPLRLWQRSIILHCPEKLSDFMALRDNFENWEHRAIISLLRQQQISQQQAELAIADTLGEILFDIVQQVSIGKLTYSYSQKPLGESPTAPIDTEVALKHTLQAWDAWRKAGFAKISPNLAPVLKQPEALQQQASPTVYQNFITLLNGSNSLRDLAVQMNQDLLLLTRSLIPFIRQGIVKLVEIPDVSLPTNVAIAVNTTPPLSSPSRARESPLIACVDDSPQTCQIMEKIFTGAGFRFVSIQNPVEALPTLIQHKPDLIFLDVMMPIVNGYEICSQLRRVSLFADTPMIILTGSDGLIDRVRAKVVGASDFLSKPVDAQKVLGAVRKYIHVPF